MADQSRIEWTETTWNPVTGCDKVSPGCKHCYAERMAGRLQAMGAAKYRDGFQVRVHPHELEAPLRWRRPRVVFVNSMSDLFHDSVPDAVIINVFQTMAMATQHTFQVLTKRSERLASLAGSLPWPPNVWMGVSVESPRYFDRIAHLQGVPAAVRFLSLEPLLAPLPGLPLGGIGWVIVGGESGPGARPMEVAWVREIRDRCQEQGVAFFFKQWGGVQKKRTGRELDGRLHDGMPMG